MGGYLSTHCLALLFFKMRVLRPTRQLVSKRNEATQFLNIYLGPVKFGQVVYGSSDKQYLYLV
jgi:hypothetical protein